jgi:hypothetical protein
VKTAVVQVISGNHIASFRKDDIKAIIFTAFDTRVDYQNLAKDFKLINAYHEPLASNWHCYAKVETQLNRIRNKLPRIFKYGGYDLGIALNKDLMWSLLATYALEFQAEKARLEHGAKVVYYDKRNGLLKRIALANRLFLRTYAGYKLAIPDRGLDNGKNIAIRINNEDLLDVYGLLFSKLSMDKVISFQTNASSRPGPRLSRVFSQNIGAETKAYGKADLTLPEKLKLFLLGADADFINAFVVIRSRLCNHFIEYERLFKSGIKKVLVNAGENEGEGNVLCALATRYGTFTYNYMNGTKARDPQNLNTHFTYWFMPDQATQDLIHDHTGLERSSIPITGHLLKELCTNHIYSGSLDKILTQFAGKKVVALLSSKIFAAEKIEVIEALHLYLEKHPDIIVLIRNHPSETAADFRAHSRIIQLPPFGSGDSQSSLFDLLSKAHVGISFSSTVSFQVPWFKIPSINFERSEISRLPFVDNVTVFHANTLKKLIQLLDDFLYKGVKIPAVDSTANPSEEIANYITKFPALA